MTSAKHVGAVAAVAIMFAAMSSQADDSRKPSKDRKGAGRSFDGQVEVPAPFARGSAFLLSGSDDCYFLYPAWTGMALDTRDERERAGGVDTPGFPMACARSGANVTCKVFKDGMTAAFNAAVKTDTAAQLSFATAGGYIDMVVDLQKKTATFKQTLADDTQSCTMKYKSREEASDDVAKLDPPPASALPAKDRANGAISGGNRLTCKSRHDSLAPKDPLTGRRASVCSACTDSCSYVGEECKAGVCVYTGAGVMPRGSDDEPSSSRGSNDGPPKKKGKGLGQSCKSSSECRSDLSCKAVSAKRSTCR